MQNIISLVQILAHGGEMSWAESCFDLCIPLQVTAVILRRDFFFFFKRNLSLSGVIVFAVHCQGKSFWLVTRVHLTK